MEPVPVLARCIKLLAPYSKALHACCLQQCPLATHIAQQKKCFARSKIKTFGVVGRIIAMYGTGSSLKDLYVVIMTCDAARQNAAGLLALLALLEGSYIY